MVKRGFHSSAQMDEKGFGASFSPVEVGSVDLNVAQQQFLLVTNSANFAPGTGDFTVEWWQYVDTAQVFMRSFSIGAYSAGCTMAVAIQSPNIYYWLQSAPSGVGTSLGAYGTIVGVWTHWALVRASGVVKMYKNGSNISGAGSSDTSNATYDASKYFAIGDETTDGAASTIPGSTGFDGRIANFHFVNGTALYTANFVPPTRINVVANTKLALPFKNGTTMLVDTSGNNAVVASVNGASWSSSRP